jgi:hypothetical protein
MISISFHSKNVILYIRITYTIFKNKKSIMNNKRQETLKNAYQSHRESMRKSLNNRLEAARVEGNEQLIKQLEAEAQYLHL